MACISESEATVRKLTAACAALPPARGNYLETDPLRVCVLAVVDYQQLETTVLRATRYFGDEALPKFGLHSLEDLDRFLAEHPNNFQASKLLWNYNLYPRAALLRSLVKYFPDYGNRDTFASDLDCLKHWAAHADFHRDFEGKVRAIVNGRVWGLGIKAFSMIQQRLGVPTAAPDSRIKAFIEQHVGSVPRDEYAVSLLNAVADRLGKSRTELDWAVWEYDKKRPVNV